MNKINKRVLIILAVLSVLIIGFGIFEGFSIKNEIIKESTPTENIYLDGSDVTAITTTFSELGAGMLAFGVIMYTVLIVAGMWVIYGIVLLIIKIIKKCKEKRKNK